MDNLPNEPILTLADTPNATTKGVAINMNLLSRENCVRN
ncbi:hypothetical protein [Nitrosomonas sp.]|nr:hypothetical protein [Nitrosomonas sp.]